MILPICFPFEFLRPLEKRQTLQIVLWAPVTWSPSLKLAWRWKLEEAERLLLSPAQLYQGRSPSMHVLCLERGHSAAQGRMWSKRDALQRPRVSNLTS